MDNIRSKKSVTFLSFIILLFSISFFIYTDALATKKDKELPCEVCSGTEDNEECVYVNIGANDHCIDSSMGDCDSWGNTFCP